jgi:hypothetical protein
VELNQAQAEGRADGERRRRWLTLGLTLGVGMLLLAIIGMATWERDKRHLEERQASESAMEAHHRMVQAKVGKQVHRYAASAHLYKEAFTLMQESTRLTYDHYDAAVVAALAAVGEGKDASGLNAEERCSWRRQALEWLWTDLISYRQTLDGNMPENRKKVQDRLRHWQRDSELSGLRDEAALARLPAEDREDCRQLWTEVEALLRMGGEQ